VAAAALTAMTDPKALKGMPLSIRFLNVNADVV
jgi:hypothetical protein